MPMLMLLGWKKPGQGLNIRVIKQEEAKKSHIDRARATGAVNSQGFIRKLAWSSFFPWLVHPGLVEGAPAESRGLEWDEFWDSFPPKPFHESVIPTEEEQHPSGHLYGTEKMPNICNPADK